MTFVTVKRAEAADVMAPDGSEVRLLASSTRGSMAEFLLHPGAVSRPVAHRSVEEVWLVIAGRGRMWRKLREIAETVDLHPGISIAIPPGASFQFRNDGTEPLRCAGVTMPPWPGMDEAQPVEGCWPVSV